MSTLEWILLSIIVIIALFAALSDTIIKVLTKLWDALETLRYRGLGLGGYTPSRWAGLWEWVSSYPDLISQLVWWLIIVLGGLTYSTAADTSPPLNISLPTVTPEETLIALIVVG